MAKLNRSPSGAVASGGQSGLLDSFNKFVGERVKALQADADGYANSKPSPGTTTPPQRILQAASYIPADTSRYTIGRGGETPQYVVIARIGYATDKTAQGSLVAELTEAVSSSGNGLSPHVVVGLGGDIVQLVDFENTAQYLKGSAPPPSALSTSQLEEAIIDSVMETTAAIESSSQGYSAFNPNDVGTGVAYGFIQFNQGLGLPSSSLARLLQKMNEKNSAKFHEIFGASAAMLLDPAQVQSRSSNLPSLEAQFRAAGQVPDFQQAQRALAKEVYWTLAATVAQRLKLTTQRAYAIFFDTAVQRGQGFVFRAASEVAGITDPSTRLYRFAELADTWDFTHLRPLRTTYQRRRDLYYNTQLSDSLLQFSENVVASNKDVSDATSVIVLLEGRVNDSVTVAQRNAAAQVIRDVCDIYGINPATSARIFGLDRLSGFGSPSNPGEGFAYVDLLGAVAGLRATDPSAVFRQSAPITGDAVTTASSALIEKLRATRAQDPLSTLPVLQAYDAVRALDRANGFATFTRAQHVAAQQAQNALTVNQASVSGAQIQQGAQTIQPVAGMNDSTLVGLLYNFDTGLWNDKKAVGKIDTTETPQS